MITKEKFKKIWTERYGHIPPIGYILRYHFANDRWVRVHNLPNSKRYADNESEMQAILERQNMIIGDLIGNREKFILLLYTYAFCESDAPQTSETSDAIILDSFRLDLIEPEFFEIGCRLHTVIFEKTWSDRSLDEYLQAIANEGTISFNYDEKSYSVLIISMNKNRVIAPYDGGVDLFLNTREERDAVKAKYSEFLSCLESGL